MTRFSKISTNPIYWLLLALLFTGIFKAWLIIGNWIPFNSDEAIVALMARHILAGERPIFFYGQAYMGSLDAYLVAGGFWLFGQQVWVIRLVQSALYIVFLVTTFWLGKLSFGSWQVGAISALLLAIPTVNISLYTTATLGGYVEALVIGNLILILALQIDAKWRMGVFPGPIWLWFVFGFLNGLGLWAFSLAMVYSIPAFFFLLINAIRLLKSKDQVSFSKMTWHFGILFFGAMVGSAPWLIYAFQNGVGVLLRELQGGAIANVEGLSWAGQISQHLFNLVLFGSTAMFGLRPPWSIEWLALPLLPFVLIFWISVLGFLIWIAIRPTFNLEKKLLCGVVFSLILVFVLSPFGADPSGRYFLPLATPLALFAADLILTLKSRVGVRAYGLVVLLMVFQFWGNLQAAFHYPPGLTTQFDATTQIDHRYDNALISFLLDNNITRGYTNYWVAFPLAFLSNEQLIFIPGLPYHHDFRYTSRDDRYAPYDQLVAQADRIAYITSHHPQLDAYLEHKLSGLGVEWQETRIGDYHVFYTLTKQVRPTEIGLGETTNP